jgi:hypothetical protein
LGDNQLELFGCNRSEPGFAELEISLVEIEVVDFVVVARQVE